MRCTSDTHAPGCNGECATRPRPLTRGEQARIDRYMDAHHPRVYAAPTRRTATLHVVTMGRTNPSDETGCEETLVCPCERCEIARQNIRPRSERNADPFRRAA